MTKVYIIRHAEADGNLYRRVHGHYDGLVTQNGLQQIKALEKRFENERIDAIYASDLYRARKTAGALYLPRDYKPIVSPILREINLGVWEDVPWGEAAIQNPDEFSVFTNEPWRFNIAGGESMREMSDRICRAVSFIAEQNKDKTIAIVTHGMAIRALLCHFDGHDLKELKTIPHCDNTGVSLVEFDKHNHTRVVFKNSGSHLNEEISTFARQRWWRSPESADARRQAMLDINLVFRPVDIETELDIVESFRKDAWKTIHGDLRFYSESQNLKQTERMARADPRAVVFAMRAGEIAGLIQLDVEDEKEQDTGHISFVYLKEGFRGKQLGIQLIGHAVSVYRKRGKRYLRLRVAGTNKSALKFYHKAGFYCAGSECGPTGTMYVMRKEIFPDI